MPLLRRTDQKSANFWVGATDLSGMTCHRIAKVFKAHCSREFSSLAAAFVVLLLRILQNPTESFYVSHAVDILQYGLVQLHWPCSIPYFVVFSLSVCNRMVHRRRILQCILYCLCLRVVDFSILCVVTCSMSLSVKSGLLEKLYIKRYHRLGTNL